jgi:regulator-associated protein of mTOR
MQRGGARELVSGSTDGRVMLWDIRQSDPVVTFRSSANNMMAIAIHEHAPVVATASQTLRYWTTYGNSISTVRPPTPGYVLGSKSQDISTLAFHPHRMLMAVNILHDSHISIFSAGRLQHDL